jgi:hypothetical protein
MSLANFPAAVVETILIRLAALFLIGAGGDTTAARRAATQMLGAYHPETEDELRLAAHIIGFSFHALEALGQAAAPDLPVTRVLRLRGSAVSLSRESEKAQRRLSQLQKNRPAEARPERAGPSPKIENPIQKIAVKATGLTWTQSYELRQRDMRIAASLKRAEARIATQAKLMPDSHSPPTTHTAPASPAQACR